MIAVETPIDPITKKPDYQALCAEVIIHDPWIAEYQGDLLERAMGCGVAILMVKQQAYYAIDLAALRNVLRTPILIDGRHMFELSQAQTVDLIYGGQGAKPIEVEFSSLSERTEILQV